MTLIEPPIFDVSGVRGASGKLGASGDDIQSTSCPGFKGPKGGDGGKGQRGTSDGYYTEDQLGGIDVLFCSGRTRWLWWWWWQGRTWRCWSQVRRFSCTLLQ